MSTCNIELRKITADETIPLRHQVLWPTYPISHVRLPEDDHGHHFGAFLPLQTAAVAVISAFPEPLPHLASASDAVTDNPIIALRFRKFACQPTYQGQGIGTQLLTHVFHIARAEFGCRAVWCDARLATADWYRRRGMQAFGDTFWKGDIEYVRMKIDV